MLDISANIFHDCEVIADYSKMTYEEWQGLRREQQGIGGSDAATVLGVSKYKDAAQLYMEKKGLAPLFEGNKATEWGKRLEQAVAEKFQDEHKELEVKEYPYFLQSLENPFMFANIDRLLHDKEKGEYGILEIKTSGAFSSTWEVEGIPEDYFAQLQHYFSVTGAKWGYFAVLIGGQQYFEIYVKRDNEFIDNLVFHEQIFHMYLETDQMPPLTDSESSKQLLSIMYPQHEEKEVELSLESGMALMQIKVLKEEMKALKEQIKAKDDEIRGFENIVKSEMQEIQKGTWQDLKAMWTTVSGRTTIDSKLLKEKYPDVYESVKIIGDSYRKFHVK